MEIRILTNHDVCDAGASLQAYAMRKYLNDLGNKVNIIDYMPLYYTEPRSLEYCPNPKLNHLGIRELYLLSQMRGRMKMREKQDRFDDFTDACLGLMGKYQTASDIEQGPPDVPLYVVCGGSLWNPALPSGLDRAFFFSFVNRGTMLAYGMSFACDEYPAEGTRIIRQQIPRITHVSVRSEADARMALSLGAQNATVVCDNIYLLSEADWRESTPGNPCPDRYLFVHNPTGSAAADEAIRALAARKELKICTDFKCRYADYAFPYQGPQDFLGMIAGASVVIANDYYAAAFAALYHRDFVVFADETAPNRDACMLARSLGLDARIVAPGAQVPGEILDEDWEAADRTRETLVQKSKAYIADILASI